MNIGHFNARGFNDVEHWFTIINRELSSRGHEVRHFNLRAQRPLKWDIEWMDFGVMHFSQVAHFYRKMGIPFCVLPSANDCLVDDGKRLKEVSEHPNCKFVTYQSAFHLRKYNEWGIKPPYVYVPMPARVNLFQRETPLGNKIIAGGRLIPKKGLHQLKDVENLTIFGDGPLKQELEKQLPNAEFVGWLDGKELKELMEDSWLFLCPSVITSDGDSEGIPNTIKEAMLMNLQVIASPIAGIPELENICLLSDWNRINGCIDVTERNPNWKGMKEITHMYSPEHCVNLLMDGIEKYGTYRKKKV